MLPNFTESRFSELNTELTENGPKARHIDGVDGIAGLIRMRKVWTRNSRKAGYIPIRA